MTFRFRGIASKPRGRRVAAMSVAFFLACTTTATTARDGATGAERTWTAAAEAFEGRLRQEHVVGAAAVLMRDGNQVDGIEYGFQDMRSRTPVDRDTIFHWASNTKTMTAIAIMQLRDAGLLELDDPVTRYLPGFRAIHNPFGSPDDITIRHLLTHSSGLRNRTWPWTSGQAWQPFEPARWSQLVAMFPYTRIRFPPGSKFGYSNLGFAMLGRIVESISGEDIETYLDKHVLKPLGMNRSYFDLTPWHLRGHRSHNYFVDPDGAVRDGPTEFDTGTTVANGGLNAPVSDMVKYANFLLGTHDEGNHDIVLSRASLAEMLSPAIMISETGDRRNSIGLAFFISPARGGDGLVTHTWFGHGGSQAGFLSWMKFDADCKLALLIAVNTTGTDGHDIAADTLRTAVENAAMHGGCNGGEPGFRR